MPVREGFFAFLEDVAATGDGFALMGGVHITMLGAMAALIAALCVIYKRQDEKGRSAMLKLIILIIFSMEAVKQLTFPLIHKWYWVGQLPLHLCGISIAIELAHAFFPSKATREILYSLCLPGAVAALLFCNWSMFPLWNFYCLQSFFIHALHVSFPLMLLVTGDLRPRAGQLWRVALFLAGVVPLVYLLNLRLSTNFFFVNAGSQGSPLEIFIEWAGNPGFLLPYAGLIAAIWLLMYAPWYIWGPYAKHRQLPSQTHS